MNDGDFPLGFSSSLDPSLEHPRHPRPPGHANTASVGSQVEGTNLAYLAKRKKRSTKGRKKRGWEGTHHHDNTGRSRTNAIKKYGGNVVHPVIPVPTQKKKGVLVGVFVRVCACTGWH